MAQSIHVRLPGQRVVHDSPTSTEEQSPGGYAAKTGYPEGPAMQRKVGAEVELANASLVKEDVKQKKPSTSVSSSSSDAKHHLLDDDDEDSATPYTHNTVKGETVVRGDGWRLTVEHIGNSVIPEFITDPVDESTDAQRLVNIVTSMAAYTKGTLAKVPKSKSRGTMNYMALGNNFQFGYGESLSAGIQFTGGLKPDQIVALLEKISTFKDSGSAHESDSDGEADEKHSGKGDEKAAPKSKSILRFDRDAKREMAYSSSAERDYRKRRAQAQGPNPIGEYEGLVALMGMYIAGLYAPLTLPTDSEFRGRDFVGKDKFGSVGEALNAARGYTAGDEKAGVLPKKVNQESFERFSEFVQTGTKLDALPSAKIGLSVMSRTNLGKLRKRISNIDADQFLADVLDAGGLKGMNPDSPLFPVGISKAKQRPNRSIETASNITIKQWVAGILGNNDYQWADTSMDFEKVGPDLDTPCCSWFCSPKRAKGLVLELRSFMDRGDLLEPDEWAPFVTELIGIFRELNDDE